METLLLTQAPSGEEAVQKFLSVVKSKSDHNSVAQNIYKFTWDIYLWVWIILYNTVSLLYSRADFNLLFNLGTLQN